MDSDGNDHEKENDGRTTGRIDQAGRRTPALPPLMTGALRDLLHQQDGVVARAQLVGLAPHDVRRLLRRRDLVRVVAGVYVDHTGPMTWRQRAWTAVLHCWPAALAGDSALAAAHQRTPTPDAVVHVVVDGHRSNLVVPEWVAVRRRRDLDTCVQWHTSPPRQRYDEAVLDVAIDSVTGSRDEFGAITVIADAVQSRRTTACRLLDAIDRRSRVPRRDFLRAVLVDVAEGACSVLERGYLHRVERAHGLPTGLRQFAVRNIRRDVQYGHRVVEIDGRLFHDTAAARDADLDRDLDTAIDREHTVRISWGQVFSRPCRTAERLVHLLLSDGLAVRPHPCGPGCPVGRSAAA